MKCTLQFYNIFSTFVYIWNFVLSKKKILHTLHWNLCLQERWEMDFLKLAHINPKGNQSRIFIERADAEADTPILWQPDVKN